MFYSANELAGLPGLPGTVQGVRWTLNRITETHPEWKRKREGTKAFEYHIDCLPAEAQKVLRKRLTHQVLEDAQLPAVVEQKAVKNVAVRDELEVMVKCPELALREVQSLTDKQKAIADARILLATEVHKLREYAGMTRKAALKHIVDGVRMGALPDRIIEAANTANARQGKRTGVSTGSLDGWYSSWVMARGDANQLLALLAPGHHKGTPWEQVWWLSDFFMFYRSWKRPTVEYAYREFSAWWHEKHADDAGMLAALPSVHAVRRVLSSVPVIVKERFRSTGSAWRSLNPFVRRDWTSLPVNAVWVG
ncbi:transposase, partial [Escherichia coli]|nr:transposase [Escherichia coli]